MSEQREIEVSFKFDLDAKPLEQADKGLNGVKASLRDAGEEASRFAVDLNETHAKLQALAKADKLDIFGDEAAAEVQRAAAQVDLLAVKLADAERKAEKAAKELEKAKEGTREWNDAAQALAKAEAEAAGLLRTLKAVPTQLETSADRARILASEMESYDKRIRAMSDQVDVYGDISTRVMPIAGLAGAVNPQASQAIMIGADVVDLGEQLPKLKEALVEVGGRVVKTADRIKDAAQSSKLLAKAQQLLTGTAEVTAVSQQAVAASETAVATEGAGATLSLGSVAVSLTTMVAAAAPFVIAIGGIVLAVKSVIDAFNAGNDAIKEFLTAQEEDLAARKEAAALARDITKEQLAAREEEQRVSVAFAEKRVEDLKNQRQIVEQMTAEMGASFDPLKRKALGDAAALLDEQLADATAALEEEQDALDTTTGYLRESAEARWKEEAAIEAAVGETGRRIDAIAREATAQQRLARIAETMSQDQLDAARKAARENKAIAEDQIASYKDLARETAGVVAALEAKGELDDEERVRLEAARESLDLYNQAIARNEEAAAEASGELDDLAAAAPLVAQREREQAAVEALDLALQQEIETRDLVRTATRDQVREQLRALGDEEAALRGMLPKYEALAGSSDAAAQKVDELRGRLDDISTQRVTLEDVVMPAAFEREARDAWRQGVEAFGKYQDDLARMETRAADARVKVADDAARKIVDLEVKAADARAKTIQEAERKVIDAQAKAIDARADALSEQSRSLVDVDRKARREVVDLERELARDRAKVVRDAAREEVRIRKRQQLEDKLELKRHYKSLSDLALSRDVAGFIAEQEGYAFEQEEKRATRGLDAEERGEDTRYELQALKAAGVERAAEIRRQRGEEIRAIKEGTIEKLAAIREERDREIAAAKAGVNEKLAQIEAQKVQEINKVRAGEQEKLAQIDIGLAEEQARRREAYAQEIRDLEDHLAGRDGAMQEGWAELETGFRESLAGLGGDFSLLTGAGAEAIETGQAEIASVVETKTAEQIEIVGAAYTEMASAATTFAGEVAEAASAVTTAGAQVDPGAAVGEKLAQIEGHYTGHFDRIANLVITGQDREANLYPPHYDRLANLVIAGQDREANLYPPHYDRLANLVIAGQDREANLYPPHQDRIANLIAAGLDGQAEIVAAGYAEIALVTEVALSGATAITTQFDSAIKHLGDTARKAAENLYGTAKAMQSAAAMTPARPAGGGDIHITLQNHVHNPQYGEFVSPSQHRRDMEMLSNQVTRSFQQLVRDIQRAIR